MPKGQGRPSNKKERQAVQTLKSSSEKTGRGFQARQTLNSRFYNTAAREYGAKGRSDIAEAIRESSRQKRGPGIRNPPKGFK